MNILTFTNYRASVGALKTFNKPILVTHKTTNMTWKKIILALFNYFTVYILFLHLKKLNSRLILTHLYIFFQR